MTLTTDFLKSLARISISSANVQVWKPILKDRFKGDNEIQHFINNLDKHYNNTNEFRAETKVFFLKNYPPNTWRMMGCLYDKARYGSTQLYLSKDLYTGEICYPHTQEKIDPEVLEYLRQRGIKLYNDNEKPAILIWGKMEEVK